MRCFASVLRHTSGIYRYCKLLQLHCTFEFFLPSLCLSLPIDQEAGRTSIKWRDKPKRSYRLIATGWNRVGVAPFGISKRSAVRGLAPRLGLAPPLTCPTLSDPLHAYKGRSEAAAAIEGSSVLGELDVRSVYSVGPNLFRDRSTWTSQA